MEINNIKVDKYGDLIIGTPKFNNFSANLKPPNKFSLSFIYPNNDILLSKPINKNKHTFMMKNDHFINNCKKNEDGSRELILNGKDIYSRIGRRLQNWDIPYLKLFLLKNRDITILTLPNNDINCAGFMSLIDIIIVCDNISELNLKNNNIKHFGVNYLLRKGEKLKLRILRLSGNKIGVENSKNVALMLSTNPYIRQLDVAETDQNEASLIYFLTVLRKGNIYSNHTLKVLDLSRPNPQGLWIKFDSSHIATVVGIMLRNNTSLEELHLQKFGFSCHDIEEMFENARYNTTLRVLDLNANNIGDYGAQVLGLWLRTGPVLRSLLLGHNIITNNGLRLLSRGIKFSKLETIDVSFNRFTDDGGVLLLYAIKKLLLVNQLRVYGNNIGHPMAKIIKEMLLSNFFEQENIDVKPYEVDGILHLAYYNILNSKEPSFLTESYHSTLLYSHIFNQSDI